MLLSPGTLGTSPTYRCLHMENVRRLEPGLNAAFTFVLGVRSSHSVVDGEPTTPLVRRRPDGLARLLDHGDAPAGRTGYTSRSAASSAWTNRARRCADVPCREQATDTREASQLVKASVIELHP